MFYAYNCSLVILGFSVDYFTFEFYIQHDEIFIDEMCTLRFKSYIFLRWCLIYELS